MLSDTDLYRILMIALSEVALVEIYVVSVRLRAMRRAGTKMPVGVPGADWLTASWLVLCFALLAFWLPGLRPSDLDSSLMTPVFALLSVGASTLLLIPRASSRALGPTGVISGWTSARFEELEEWRLSGDHLRFRLAGRLWDAVEVPPERHAELRAQLERAAPGRESRYAV